MPLKCSRKHLISLFPVSIMYNLVLHNTVHIIQVPKWNILEVCIKPLLKLNSIKLAPTYFNIAVDLFVLRLVLYQVVTDGH